jgi:hypothetical protein
MPEIVICVENGQARDAGHNPRRWDMKINGTLLETWVPSLTNWTVGSGSPSPGKFYTTSSALNMVDAYSLDMVNIDGADHFVDKETISPSLFVIGTNHITWETSDPYDSGIAAVIVHWVDSNTGAIITTLYGSDVGDRTFFTDKISPDTSNDAVFTLASLPSGGGSSWTCVYTPLSSWVYKICFNPDYGVRVTFKEKGGRLFTALYPGTTLSDYNAFVAAASKGKWEHMYYYKKRPYVTWPGAP